MVGDGELDTLVPERVWKETQKALSYAQPQVFFEVLRECGALQAVFPEVDRLYGVPQPEKWHPEIDCGIHTMMAVGMAAQLAETTDVRFAALVHDLGKATTPAKELPSHPGHERRGVALIEQLCRRLSVPNDYRALAALTSEWHTHIHRAFELKASTVLKVLERCDAFRRPQRFERVLLACEADARGRAGLDDRPYPQAKYFAAALQAANQVSVAEFIDTVDEGHEIAAKLRESRLAAIKQVARSDYSE